MMSRDATRGLVAAVLVGAAAGSARANYSRLSLDDKVRLSDLIVIGTASELSEIGPFSTAVRKAVIKVDRVFKGTPPADKVVIGYRSGDEVYDVNNKERVRLPADPIVDGGSVLLFLRRAVGDMYAPVNWQYGIYPIEDGKVVDPRWPGDEVGLMYRFNITVAKEAPKAHPWMFRDRIALEAAVEHVQAAIKTAETQHLIGRLTLNGAPGTVLLEKRDANYRVLVRVPKRADCPSFDTSLADAVLIPKSGDPIRSTGGCTLEPAPPSADPIASFEQVAIAFPFSGSIDALKSAEITIGGQKRTVCIGESADCRSDAPIVRCAACRSPDTRGFTEIRYGFTDRPCGWTPDPPGARHTEPEEANIRYHCNTCLFDW